MHTSGVMCNVSDSIIHVYKPHNGVGVSTCSIQCMTMWLDLQLGAFQSSIGMHDMEAIMLECSTNVVLWLECCDV